MCMVRAAHCKVKQPRSCPAGKSAIALKMRHMQHSCAMCGGEEDAAAACNAAPCQTRRAASRAVRCACSSTRAAFARCALRALLSRVEAHVLLGVELRLALLALQDADELVYTGLWHVGEGREGVEGGRALSFLSLACCTNPPKPRVLILHKPHQHALSCMLCHGRSRSAVQDCSTMYGAWCKGSRPWPRQGKDAQNKLCLACTCCSLRALPLPPLSMTALCFPPLRRSCSPSCHAILPQAPRGAWPPSSRPEPTPSAAAL